MKSSIPILFLTIAFSASTAIADEAGPRQRAEQFLATLSRGEIDKAYDQLFAGSEVASAQPTRIDALKRQTTANLPIYGKAIGYDLVLEKSFGTSVVRLLYVLKMEKHPVVWEFFFYRPKDKWFIANVGLNDEFNGLRGSESPPKT